MRKFLFFAVLAVIAYGALFARCETRAQEAPKASAKPIATPTPDPLELSQAELADAGAILNEFKTLQEKLGTAQEDLFKAYDKGKDAFDAAAKDNYIVISKIKDVQAKYRAWEVPVKERIKCPDCTFNTQTGKMVRPQAAPKN